MAFETLAIALLRESPFNYRTQMSDAGLQELADSIKVVGVQQPLKVRPLGQEDIEHKFEVVFGHRRLRAAKLAGLHDVPVIIEDMTEERARLVQLHENIQREDPNAMDEARALYALKEEFGHRAQDLMELTGKGKTYVYSRLKLATLTGKALYACIDGSLEAETAALVAALPASLHDRALDKIKAPGHGGKKYLPYIHAKPTIKNMMAQIDTAEFDVNACDLVPNAGPCWSCDKFSRNDPTLIASIGSDICTDADCFANKTKAHRVLFVRQAKEAGKRLVLEGAEADDMLSRRVNCPVGLSQYLAYTLKGEIKHSSYDEVMDAMKERGVDVPEPMLLVRGSDGLPIERLTSIDAKLIKDWALANLADKPVPAEGSSARGASTPSTAAHAQNGALDFDDDDGEGQDQDDEDEALPPDVQAVSTWPGWNRVKKAIMLKATGMERTTDELRMLVLVLLEFHDEVPIQTGEIMGWAAELDQLVHDDWIDFVKAKLTDMSADALGALLVLLALEQAPIFADTHKEANAQKLALARTYGVDVLALQANEQGGASSAGNPAAVGGDLVDQMEG
jgi:ParB/RepB/Spo0J family partition protein